jgi:hypothetical protein
MTIAEMVFLYACVFFVLLIALAVLLLRQKSAKETLPLQPGWGAILVRLKEKAPPGDFWLKTFLAAFTALAAGLIVVIFILPYGTAWAFCALLVIGAALVVSMPRLLA